MYSYVDKIFVRVVREFNCVDGIGRVDDIGNVGNGGIGCSIEVEDFGIGFYVDGFEIIEDIGS